MDQCKAIVLSSPLRDRLLATVCERLPDKSFGYFISSANACVPNDFVLLRENIRNSDNWKPQFQSYGRYFVDHDNAGFVATPEESWRVQKQIWDRGMVEIGVFHTHLRHPANFAELDHKMHMQRFDNLWHLIISVRNRSLPRLCAFAPSHTGVRELQILAEETTTVSSGPHLPINPTVSNATISAARRLLAIDRFHRPQCTDSRAILAAVEALLRNADLMAAQEVLAETILRGSAERYEEHVAPHVRRLAGGRFTMGTRANDVRHFCGEAPSHVVELSPFGVAETPVTNELFGLYDTRRRDLRAADRQKPAVGVSWFDAAVFAMWMGCRLPTEAEWEFACGGGADAEWCCSEEADLARYAWYSENSAAELRAVATREPNAFGIFDLHGNVWEWVSDCYDQDYYSRAPRRNPLRIGAAADDKVCRGGSLHAFSEMCRTRFRFHEPQEFMATDLGFRLASHPPLKEA